VLIIEISRLASPAIDCCQIQLRNVNADVKARFLSIASHATTTLPEDDGCGSDSDSTDYPVDVADFQWTQISEKALLDSSDDELVVADMMPRNSVYQFVCDHSKVGFRPVSEALALSAIQDMPSSLEEGGNIFNFFDDFSPVEAFLDSDIGVGPKIRPVEDISKPTCCEYESPRYFQWTRAPHNVEADSSDDAADEAPLDGVVPRTTVFEFTRHGVNLGFRPLP